MPTTITRRYSFEAAHWLPKVPEEHKCRRLHGHNYLVDVTIGGQVNEIGFIIDFWDLDKIVDPIIQLVDHRTLNDIIGLENPTAEFIGTWFMYKLNGTLPLKHSIANIRIYETSNCWCDVC